MSVRIVRDVLVDVVGEQVGHYHGNKDWAPPYALYGETGAPTVVSADDIPSELRVSGEIYYYTQKEFDETVDHICAGLSGAGVSWSVTTIGWNNDLGQIEYQIHWEVPCGAGEIY